MKTRHHHYQFAYRSLPRTLLGTVAARRFVPILCGTGPAGAEGATLMVAKVLWPGAADGLDSGGKLAPDGIAVSAHPGPHATTIALVRLPPPEIMPEAHFVAAVADAEEPFWLRYFTLEHTEAQAGPTMIGEVYADGCRENLGPGPAPEEGAFLAAVRALLADERNGRVRARVLMARAKSELADGKNAEAEHSLREAITAMRSAWAYRALGRALRRLAAIVSGPEKRALLAQSYWLSLHGDMPPDETVDTARELARELGPTLGAARVMAFADWNLDTYPEPAVRSELSGQCKRVVVEIGQAFARDKDEFLKWITAQGFETPERFVPRLVRDFDAWVPTEGWAFDRQAVRGNHPLVRIRWPDLAAN